MGRGGESGGEVTPPLMMAAGVKGGPRGGGIRLTPPLMMTAGVKGWPEGGIRLTHPLTSSPAGSIGVCPESCNADSNCRDDEGAVYTVRVLFKHDGKQQHEDTGDAHLHKVVPTR